MNFFNPALQTVAYCALPVVFITFLLTLAMLLFRRTQDKKITVPIGLAYFLAIFLACMVIVFLGIWLYLIVGTEPLYTG
ncbi:MAG: hypothetical protein H6672_00710 [Anaerolineaceae bacterium]|nr:hypothetical protein [Anaerolineaceae bacterium]